MWPSQAGGGGGYYYPGWPQQTGFGGANPAAQQTDPSDWAAKAAQWAQHKQAESHYLQQMSGWQQQQQQQQYNPMQHQQQQATQPQVHSQHPQQMQQQQVPQPPHQSQYAGMGPASSSGQAPPQPQGYSLPSSSQSAIPPPAVIQPQQTQSPPVPLIVEKTQPPPKPLFPQLQSQQQGNQFQPSSSAPATSAAPASGGPGLLSESPQSSKSALHPLFDLNRPKFMSRNFRGRGFQKTVPSGRGFQRGGGVGRGGPRPQAPLPQGRGPSPNNWKKWNEQLREGFHSSPRPPTEEVFGGDERGRDEGAYPHQSGPGGHGIEASPHQFEIDEKERKMHKQEHEDHGSHWSENIHHEGGHQLEEHYPGGGGDSREGFHDRGKPLHRLQDDWSTFQRGERPGEWGERREGAERNFEKTDRPSQQHGTSPYDQQAQYEKEEHDLYHSDQDSQASSQQKNDFGVESTTDDKLYGDSSSLATISSQISNEPTISSLRSKDSSAVIPGLGELDNKEGKSSENVGQELSTSDDRKEKQSSDEAQGGGQGSIDGGQANEMIQSLGKIVSQLQTLKGLTSSLQLLKALPKGSQEEDEMAMKEKDISEDAKRKVAALFANESDSEGEQNPPRSAPLDAMDEVPRRMPPDSYRDDSHHHHYRDLPRGTSTGDPSPPAREFDGTYNVKPQVYNTYSNEDERRPRDTDHRDDYRDNPQYYPQSRGDHDYPPHQSRGPPPQDYYPRDRGYGGPESRYNQDMERDYDRQRIPPSQYDQRGYEQDPGSSRPPPPMARDYSPPGGDHFRRPLGEYDQPPPVAGRGREGGQYYDQPPDPGPVPRGRPPVAPEQSEYSSGPSSTSSGNISSKIQTIDYSHGSGMHTVDYNHGSGGTGSSGGSNPSAAGPYRERPPRAGGEYPRDFPPFAGTGQFPPFPSQYPFPGSPAMFAGMAAGGYLPSGLDPATLFAAYSQAGESKRNTLPLWLREELEKMERKKQKKLAKEAEEALRRGEQREGRPKWRDELNSDEEDEEEEDRKRKKRRSKKESPVSERKSHSHSHRSYRHSRSKSPGRSESGSPTPRRKRRKEELPIEDEEDKHVSMVMKVRKMLTEILLDVTDQEVESVAKEAYEEAKKPKMAFTMKQQMIAASKENILAGLSMYASDSESEEEPDRQKRSSSKSKSRFSNEPPSSTSPPTSTKGEFKMPKEPAKSHHRKESSKSSSKSKNEEGSSSISGSSSKSSSSSKSKHGSSSSSSSSDKEKKEKKKEKSSSSHSSSHKDSKGSGSSSKKKSSSSDSEGRDKERGKDGSSSSSSKRHSSSSKSDRTRSPSSLSPPPRKSSSSKHKSSSSSSSRGRSRSRSRSPSKSSKSSSSKSKSTPSSSHSSSSRRRSDSFTTTTPSRSKSGSQRSPSPHGSGHGSKRSRHRSRSRSRSHSPLERRSSSERRSLSSSKNKSSPPQQPRSNPVSTYRVVQIKP